MILVKPSYKILSLDTNGLYLIELAGRTCYKSEDLITPESAEKFVKKINDLGHHSVLEHSFMSVKFIVDRGVSHELVRHRLCAFSQESTRYCNYKGGVTFVIPPWCSWREGKFEYGEAVSGTSAELFWLNSMIDSEIDYLHLLGGGWTPQQARSVLPNSTKTEIVVSTNYREWKHIFKLRCSKKAHPQMREIMIPLLEECKRLIPQIFSDIEY